MRKISMAILVFAMILLMTVPLFALSARDGTWAEGKSSFQHVATRGYSRDVGADTSDGIPGYYEITSVDGKPFYMFVDQNGYLRIASATQVGTTDTNGKPSTTQSWKNVGDIVGEQTDD